jgi:hypothetical protein
MPNGKPSLFQKRPNSTARPVTVTLEDGRIITVDQSALELLPLDDQAEHAARLDVATPPAGRL